jgi:hypothetical protein
MFVIYEGCRKIRDGYGNKFYTALIRIGNEQVYCRKRFDRATEADQYGMRLAWRFRALKLAQMDREAEHV